jgi:glycosyltransferase involved in cell wall biosynthesis
MRVLTNTVRFPERWQSESTGLEGTALVCNRFGDFVRHLHRCDMVLVNCDPPLTFRLCALFTLFPFLRKPLVVNDLVLRTPLTLRARLVRPVKKLLLRRVDRFIHHFLDLEGYRKYFGIGPERSSYTPSKPNFRYRNRYAVSSEGSYILCYGRSERDYDTLFEAVSHLPYPVVIPQPDFAKMRYHRSRFTWPLSKLPPNVRIAADDGSTEGLIRLIEGAKLVVLPIVKSRIGPSGIGTYMNVMLLEKCTIISGGVSTSDVLTDQALLVPPEDPDALADTIRRAWEDDALRIRTAQAGRRYAEECGGEPDVHRRFFELALQWYQSRPRG